MAVSPWVPLGFSIITIGAALFYAFSQTDATRLAGKHITLICIWLTLIAASIAAGQPTWMDLAFALVFVLWFLFWVMDMLMPVFSAVLSFVGKGRKR